MDTIAKHFEGKTEQLKAAYDKLIAELKALGPVTESPKQTSIHLEKTSGFAGVHPRKTSFNLEFRTDGIIDSPRIVRHQQLSARRHEHTVKINSPADIDAELLGWLKEAYTLAK